LNPPSFSIKKFSIKKMVHTVAQEFFHFLQQYPLIARKQWLVAVSGGLDSVVLCYLCKQNNVPFAMAHCNFQLRGTESDRDKDFVISLAKAMDKTLFQKDFDTKEYMAKTGKSVQVAARDLRYTWFNELLSNNANPQPPIYDHHPLFVNDHSPLSTTYSLLATAHHANDNIETVLMNLFRGTGIKGLRGIQPVHDKIIRPLLGITKEAMLEYAKAQGLSWVEDSSNSSDKYTRNFIRNQVMPLMEQVIPRDEMGFEKSLEMLAEAEMLYDEAIAQHKKKLVEIKGSETHIPVLKLAASKPLKSIVYEIIKPFGFSSAQTDEVISLLESESGKYVASATNRIIRNRSWLIIAPQKTENAGFVLIEKGEEHISFAEGEFNIQSSTFNPQFSISKSADVALLDVAAIQFPIILRPWKQGDYFYPLGMMKKKKLSRFFIDQKISKTDKEKIWVIESNKKILWVVGHRIDERFKVTDATSAVVRMQWKPKS